MDIYIDQVLSLRINKSQRKIYFVNFEDNAFIDSEYRLRLWKLYSVCITLNASILVSP